MHRITDLLETSIGISPENQTKILYSILIMARKPFTLGDRVQIGEHAEDLSADAEKKIIEASKKYMIFYQYLTPIVYTSVKESGILLTMRYICDAQRRRVTEHEIWEDVLTAFAKCKDIEFAYPTQRFYTRPAEKDDSPL